MLREKSAKYGWVPGKENYRSITTLFDCALYKINLKAICRKCQHSKVLDAPGYWWQCEERGLSDNINAFSKRLYCQSCFDDRAQKVRKPILKQTGGKADGMLLSGPSDYEWKRIINRQRS